MNLYKNSQFKLFCLRFCQQKSSSEFILHVLRISGFTSLKNFKAPLSETSKNISFSRG